MGQELESGLSLEKNGAATMSFLNQALLIAGSDAELHALAQTILLATSSENVARQQKWETVEARYLVALMAHEKQNAKPKFENIELLLCNKDSQVIAPVLEEVWANDSEAVRKPALNSLIMRIIELCVQQDPFLGAK